MPTAADKMKARLAKAGIAAIKVCPSETGTGDVRLLSAAQADKHGLRGEVVMLTFPRPIRVSEGGDAIRDAEGGRARAYGTPHREYYDASEVRSAGIEVA